MFLIVLPKQRREEERGGTTGSVEVLLLPPTDLLLLFTLNLRDGWMLIHINTRVDLLVQGFVLNRQHCYFFKVARYRDTDQDKSRMWHCAYPFMSICLWV